MYKEFLVIVYFLVIPKVFGLEDKFKPRISGGQEVDISEFPYQVSLQENHRHICGGSILSDQYILTAAHCINYDISSIFSVRVGSSQTYLGGQEHAICAFQKHPNYNQKTLDSDIAIVKLCSRIELSKNVAKIGLPNANDPLPEGQTAFISGWGLLASSHEPVTLNAAQVTILSRDMCRFIYRGMISSNMLCAGENGSCEGDSGGALVVGGVQIGIVSWGVKCGTPNKPSVYTLITPFRQWIKRLTNI